MTEIHRRGAFYVTSEEPGVYRVWRDAAPSVHPTPRSPRLVCTARGRNAAQNAREDCADCADTEARKDAL